VGQAALEVSGLTHVYRAPQGGQLVALADLSFSVRTGEFVGVVGPSGCGKSTLLRILADVIQPTSGLARVHSKSPAIARAAREFSFVFQRPVLFEWRSVLENVKLPLEIERVAAAEREERSLAALRLMGMERFARYAPWQLSAGMQQRVGLARALVTRPSVLFLDEPFASLDEIAREDLNAELASVCERLGTTALLVTHSVPEAVWLCDRVIVMATSPGRIVDVVNVPLPRPRERTVRESNAFFHTVVQVQRILRGDPDDELA
jgi:NitT/TauT family transport system ATP-binding protein